MKEDFGKFLSESRKKVQLTQKQLADKLFVSESTISKWEKNKANPDISMIPQICEVLNISEHELITASVDKEDRLLKAKARKWTNLSLGWNLFFYISYGITLLTCFICNISVSHTLDWFWIVFFSLVLTATFTTFPQFIKKARILCISIMQLCGLLLLLLVCCIFTKGDWYIIAITPIIFGFVVIFLPIYLKKYKINNFITRHRNLINIIIDIILYLIMMAIFNYKTNGHWFIDFVLPISCVVMIALIVYTILINYCKISKLLKAFIVVLTSIPVLITEYIILDRQMYKAFGERMNKVVKPNLLKWTTTDLINSNIYLCILLALLLTGATLLILYFVLKNKKGKKS